ncbi:CvpA family protein [bacterium]|nr:CvpA family protein [bacterium]
MTLLDWGLLVVVGFFFVRGFFRGFFVELFSLLALLAGYLVARFAGPPLGLYLSQQTPLSRWIAGILAAVLLFIAANLIIQLVGRFLKGVMKKLQMGGFDRMFGSLFGAGKAAVIFLAIFFLLALTPFSDPVGRYVEKGRISGWFWIGGLMVRDASGIEPKAPTMLMAKWLRAAGVDDEIVHMVTDRPDLMLSILDYARTHDVDIPVTQILAGEPSITLPDTINIGPDQQKKLLDLLEDSSADVTTQAKKFWEVMQSSKSL